MTSSESGVSGVRSDGGNDNNNNTTNVSTGAKDSEISASNGSSMDVDAVSEIETDIKMSADLDTAMATKKPGHILITMRNYGADMYLSANVHRMDLNAFLGMPKEYAVSEVVQATQPCNLAFVVTKGHGDTQQVEVYAKLASECVQNVLKTDLTSETVTVIEDEDQYRVILKHRCTMFQNLSAMNEFVMREMLAPARDRATSSDAAQTHTVECKNGLVLWRLSGMPHTMEEGKSLALDMLLGRYNNEETEESQDAPSPSHQRTDTSVSDPSPQARPQSPHHPHSSSSPPPLTAPQNLNGEQHTKEQTGLCEFKTTRAVFRVPSIREYYANLFPAGLLWEFLERGSYPAQASTREFMCDYGGPKLQRHLAFQDHAHLANYLQKKTPLAVHVSCSQTCHPKRNRLHTDYVQTCSRELMFDIDGDDYNDVKVCCGNKRAQEIQNVCDACWCFLACAVHGLNWFLKTYLGFKHVLWVFSGRRGVHAWVVDQRCTDMTNNDRKCITDRLELLKQHNEKDGKMKTFTIAATGAAVSKLEEGFGRALEPYFKRLVCEKQGLFTNITQVKHWCDVVIRSRLGDDATTEMLVDTPRSWDQFKTVVTSKWPASAKRVICDMILLHSFPRIDRNVTPNMKHMLKIPFTTHAITTRVCVPLPKTAVEEFLPSLCSPALEDVIKQTSGQGQTHGSGGVAARAFSDAVDRLRCFLEEVSAEMQTT